MKRSQSVSVPNRVHPVDPAFEHIHEPGGFRRNYLLLKASEQGVEQPEMLSNFVDFLYLFGHFVSIFIRLRQYSLILVNSIGW